MRRAKLILIGAAALACAAPGVADAKSNFLGVHAHRGGANTGAVAAHPENSLEGFQASHKLGADVIEMDAKLTAGQLTAAASLALLRLASRDARPHVVIRGATSALSRPTRLIRLAAAVHEDGDLTTRNPGGPTPDTLATRAWQRAQAGHRGRGMARHGLMRPSTTGLPAFHWGRDRRARRPDRR